MRVASQLNAPAKACNYRRSFGVGGSASAGTLSIVTLRNGLQVVMEYFANSSVVNLSCVSRMLRDPSMYQSIPRKVMEVSGDNVRSGPNSPNLEQCVN